MVLTFEETKELETLKHNNKIIIINHQIDVDKVAHERKMVQLKKLHDIALAGGIGYIEK